MVYPASFIEGLAFKGMQYIMPTPKVDTHVRNTLDGVEIDVGTKAGATHVRIVFGYDDSLRCSGADESCVTDSVIAPYAYIGETGLTPHAIGAGKIRVPVRRGELFKYRVQWLTSGGSVVDQTEIISAIG
jgi:hypothetical protein